MLLMYYEKFNLCNSLNQGQGNAILKNNALELISLISSLNMMMRLCTFWQNLIETQALF